MEIAKDKVRKLPLNDAQTSGPGILGTRFTSPEQMIGMLEVVPFNLMFCNTDLEILYINQKSRDTLRVLEKHLPVRIEQVVGSNVGIFHKDPSMQERLLADPRNLPHKAEFTIEEHEIELEVHPVYDTNNHYIGALASWDIVTERNRIANEVAMKQSMLESAPVNIMTADRDGNINYVNPKSVATLKTIEAALPIKVDEMVGSSIDVFHKNPAHQRKILADDRNLPISTQIEFAGEILDLKVSAIRDRGGSYVGPMVTWELVTEEEKSKIEMARVKSMMENAPINVMSADRDLNIQYLNPKSKETLKTLEKHLPIKVDEMLGAKIDVFHQNPAHQQKMLEDDRNLPHRTQIAVGDQKLDLLVSAIYDHEGNYIGPMVTWSVITEKLDLINTLEQTSSQLGGAAEELSATATQMAENSSSTSDQSNTASSAAEEVSKGVELVATNTEEMVASIKEISKASADAAEMTKEAMKRASETNDTITHLGEASQEIGNVIKVISSIAQQTNLLALNATIEAARAGDAGKGFAVVANEVKELAKQTARATEEITQKINNIQDTSKASVEAIGVISESIEKLNSIAMSIAASVEEQTATTNEVSRVVQESKTGVAGIAETIKVVAQAADQSATGANQTLDAARGLTDLAAKLKDLVEKVEL